MKPFLAFLFTLFITAILLGMGGLGGSPEGTVPKPEENIRARIYDRSGIETEVSDFSMGGKVYLEGNRGEGEMMVFFKKLQEIEFSDIEGSTVPVSLKFINGETLSLKLKKNTVFYGNIKYGAFQIRAGSIKRIEFLPSARPE